MPGRAGCINNATSVEFSVVPTARYLKFEYALGVTEAGTYAGGSWNGAVFSYPDGFALFVGGRQVADNCAVVPGTATYLTMQTAGVVAPLPATPGPSNRPEAEARLAARTADPDRPPTTPAGFAYSTQQGTGWAVRFLTVPLTCIADVQGAYLAGTPAEVKIVIADANDAAIPPAVFLKGGSVRFGSRRRPRFQTRAGTPSSSMAPTDGASGGSPAAGSVAACWACATRRRCCGRSPAAPAWS